MNTEPSSSNPHLATFGAGCFWCVEAAFLNQKGVHSAISGYMGGHIDDPTYEQVCGGQTNHAEVVQVTFNPEEISFKILLDLFWGVHNPTTLNQQGADRGTQYRSAIFYHSEEQKSIAEESKIQLDTAGHFGQPIVTEITPASTFYPAEDYHQDYYSRNKNAPYCQIVIQPKLKKLGIE
ncbi:MAG: peptide-methionine (S)-S-oxide reductase MsrA [Opitutaceae bacterium]|nr:peptide-methionine (S)-S-oxide reductase MsrA [Opitutaceae bacterium]